MVTYRVGLQSVRLNVLYRSLGAMTTQRKDKTEGERKGRKEKEERKKERK